LRTSIGDRVTGTDAPLVANNGMQPTALRAAADAERYPGMSQDCDGG
jgi:hypothetical protein